MREKYEYCSTVPRTWIVVIFSVKVSIFFCHILKIFVIINTHVKHVLL